MCIILLQKSRINQTPLPEWQESSTNLQKTSIWPGSSEHISKTISTGEYMSAWPNCRFTALPRGTGKIICVLQRGLESAISTRVS